MPRFVFDPDAEPTRIDEPCDHCGSAQKYKIVSCDGGLIDYCCPAQETIFRLGGDKIVFNDWLAMMRALPDFDGHKTVELAGTLRVPAGRHDLKDITFVPAEEVQGVDVRIAEDAVLCNSNTERSVFDMSEHPGKSMNIVMDPASRIHSNMIKGGPTNDVSLWVSTESIVGRQQEMAGRIMQAMRDPKVEGK